MAHNAITYNIAFDSSESSDEENIILQPFQPILNEDDNGNIFNLPINKQIYG